MVPDFTDAELDITDSEEDTVFYRKWDLKPAFHLLLVFNTHLGSKPKKDPLKIKS